MKLILLLVLVCLAHAQPKEDLIHNLPDIDLSLHDFKMYSGYIKAAATRKLHYVFVESQQNQDSFNTPLAIWLNGGPGCSSLEGFASEIGPFVYLKDDSTTLEFNPHSWNKQAHILFIESPAGVGFSINEESLDTYQFTDQNVADDSYNALKDFYVKFPSYLKNPLWIVGESYGGIYGPMLALKVHEDGKFNLKGTLSGNGVIRMAGRDLIISETSFIVAHNLVSPHTKDLYHKHCINDFSQYDCENVIYGINEDTQFINPYNIYDYCDYEDSKTHNNRQVMMKVPSESTLFGRRNTKQHKAAGIPCVSVSQLDTYFNRDDVKRALHVPLNINWLICVQLEGQKFKYDVGVEGSAPALQKLFDSNKYKFLFFSGDADAVVPYTDTLNQLKQFNLKIKKSWRPYLADPNPSQQSGFVQTYEGGITFATVRGAGHMAALYKRKETYYIFNQTLAGEDF